MNCQRLYRNLVAKIPCTSKDLFSLLFFSLLFNIWVFACKNSAKQWTRWKLMGGFVYHVFWEILCPFFDKMAEQVPFSNTFLRNGCTLLSFCCRAAKMKTRYSFYCYYGHVFFSDFSYGCHTWFLHPPANISQKDAASSQFKFMTKETSARDKRTDVIFALQEW